MSPEKTERTRPRAKRFGVEFEEARAWVSFYRRVGHDVTIATEVMNQLEADPEMKRRHLALYLCCKESLRHGKARRARNQRIGQFVRWLCRELLATPARLLRRGADVALECLPETANEPAASQVRRLTREAEFARAQASFGPQAAAAAAAATPGAELSASNATRPQAARTAG